MSSGKVLNPDKANLTQQAHLADLSVAYAAGGLDTEAEIIAAINATNTRVNNILAYLETLGLVASS